MLPRRFELPTSPLPRECSTPELRQPRYGNSGMFALFVGPIAIGWDGMQVKTRMLPVHAFTFYHRPNHSGLEISRDFAHFAPMSDQEKKSGQFQGPEKAKSAEKQARLSEALRANLRRRKEQARERKQHD